MRLGRLTLRTRVFVGFGVLILVGLAIAGVGAWGIDRLGKASDLTRRQTGNIQSVLAIAWQLEVVDRNLAE